MEKKSLLLLALCPAFAFGQDLIVKKDGDVIQAKVLKVGTAEVEYKKWNNQDGPLYSIEVSNILSINYENGEKEKFANVSATTAQTASAQSASAVPTEIAVKPAADNAKLLELYNNQTVMPKKPKPKDKLAKNAFPIWGIKKNSVLSDENVTVYFERRYEENKYVEYNNVAGYVVNVRNKTDRNIYIDLANSFKVDDQGMSTPYFNNKTITTNTNSGSGAGLNVGAVTGALGVGGVIGTLAGGVNVGGGSSAGVSVTEGQERILVIPPHAMASLPLEKIVDGKKIKEIPEKLFLKYLPVGNIAIKLHEFKVLFNDDNAYATNKRIITYSTTPDFSTYSRLNIEFYFRAVLGVYYSSLKYLTSNENEMKATNWNYLLIGKEIGTGH